MSTRAILFDLDGTLLDTLDDLADATNAVLSRLGFPTHPVEDFRYFVGDGLRTMVLRVLPESEQDEETVGQAMAWFREEYGRNWADKTRPYRGVPELLDALTERDFPMAVLSNKPHGFTQLCVAKLLARWDFAAIQGVSDRNPRKPDPTGALRIAERLGVPPAQWLYLGDTNTDMQTATAAGMFALGAAWGFRPTEELTANGAQAILDAPAELLDLLD
ncbi:MAG: HAD family hydrolase [Planctomycetota bacterium]